MKLRTNMKVRLREDLLYTRRRKLLVPSMVQYAGTIQTITKISSNTKHPRVHIQGYLWDMKDAIPITIENSFPKPELFDPSNLTMKGN